MTANADTREHAFHPLDPRAARARLIYALVIAVVMYFVTPDLARTTRWLIIGDVTSMFLLGTALFIIARSDQEETKRRAAAYDPGRGVVWLTVLLAAVFGLLASAAVIRQGKSASTFEAQLRLVLSFATVVISWVLTHSAFTLRYAHLYYRGEAKGGIGFPGDEDPDDSDFAYFAFTIGMCFQVSDATISSREIRGTALRHALLSFVYNTVIVALALNLVIGEFG